MSNYESETKTLRFIYNIELAETGIREMDGYAEYSYHTYGSAFPGFFWGYFYVNGLQQRFDVYGEKVARLSGGKCSKMTLSERGGMVKAFIEKNHGSITSQGWRTGGLVQPETVSHAPVTSSSETRTPTIPSAK